MYSIFSGSSGISLGGVLPRALPPYFEYGGRVFKLLTVAESYISCWNTPSPVIMHVDVTLVGKPIDQWANIYKTKQIKQMNSLQVENGDKIYYEYHCGTKLAKIKTRLLDVCFLACNDECAYSAICKNSALFQLSTNKKIKDMLGIRIKSY